MILELSPESGIVMSQPTTVTVNIWLCAGYRSIWLSPGNSAAFRWIAGEADTFGLAELTLTTVFFRTCTVKYITECRSAFSSKQT